MKKRGFTLVELLAIILILAIIALITVPMIITLIRNARKSVFRSNAEQVLSTAKMYYSKNITDDGVIIEIRENQVNKLQFMNDTTNSEVLPGFQVKGKLPQKGKITITDDGKIAFDLYNGDFCAYKTEEVNTIYILEGDNCDKNVKIPKIEGTVATKDKDKLVVVASGFYEEDNVRTPAKIVRYGFKIDNGDWKYTTNDYYIFNGLKSGSTHNIKISCTNEVGITVEKDLGNKTVSNLDTTVISAPTGWAKSKTVTITYPKGRYKYQYSLDEGVTWLSDGITNGVRTLTYSSESDNGKYVMARVLDKTGNVEEAKVLKIAGIDTTKPTCGNRENEGSTTNWRNSNQEVKVACSDDYGECSQAKFSTTYSTNTTTSSIQISDKAGNTENCSVNVYVDKTKPVCGSRTNEGSTTNWRKTAQTIKVACADNENSIESGCTSTEFSKSFSNVTTGSIQISDKAGNTENCLVNAYVDTIAPSVPTINNPYLNSWCNSSCGSFALTLSSSDNTGGSGLDHYAYSYTNGSGYNTYANSASTSFTTTPFSAERNQNVYVIACDKAGNCSSSASTPIRIDKTAPTCTVSYDTAYDGGWTKNDVIIRGTCTSDTGNSGCNTSVSPTKTYTTEVDGDYSPGNIQDNAGNTKQCGSAGVHIDKTGPTTEFIYTDGHLIAVGQPNYIPDTTFSFFCIDDKSGTNNESAFLNYNNTGEGTGARDNDMVHWKPDVGDYIMRQTCIDNVGNSATQLWEYHIINQGGGSGGSGTCKRTRLVDRTKDFTFVPSKAENGVGLVYFRGEWVTVAGYCSKMWGNGNESYVTIIDNTHFTCHYKVKETYYTNC